MFTGYVGTFYAALACYVWIAAPSSHHSLASLFLIPLGLLAFGALETWWMITDRERGEVRRAIKGQRLSRLTALLAGVITASCVAPLMAAGLALDNSILKTNPNATRASGIVVCSVFLLFALSPLAPAYWLVRRSRRSAKPQESRISE